MRRTFTFLLLLLGHVVSAQLLTTSPSFPQESNSPIDIIMDATLGNQGLKDHTPTTDVYVHIGAITNLSTGPSDWKYSKFTWGTANTAAQATYLSPNKWKYTITGGLRAYFGITNPAEVVQHIVILFRNGTGGKVQRNRDGSDMYLPVYNNSLQVRVTQPFRQPTYNQVIEPLTIAIGNSLQIASAASANSTIKLYFNGTEVANTVNGTTASANVTISASGTQQIIAEATSGTTVKRDTLSFFVTPATTVEPLPAGLKDGINYEPGDTSVTLVLLAPGKQTVSVIGDINNWSVTAQHLMKRTPDGNRFWLRITGLTPATEYGYQFLVDGNLKVADPYTEKVLVQGSDQFILPATFPNLKPYPAGQSGIVSVLQTRQPGYNWSAGNFRKPAKANLMIYELLLRDFVAAHDWKTLRDTLSYLKRLGINAIELMPVTEFEGNLSWGYNTYQYFAPDKYYGPKNTLKEFIDTCHKNGIAVIMDIVLNHTYGPSPLVQLYWDAANNRPAANNPWYNPVAPHAFGFGEDFNHETSNTRNFFKRVLQHWQTEYKIDGYRVDFSKGLTQKVSTSDAAFSAYDASRIAIINDYANTIKSVDTAAYIILEHFCDNNEERQLADSGMLLWANVWTQYQEASMGYLPNSNFGNGIHTARGWTKAHLVTFQESHDEERVTFKSIKYGNSSGGYNIRDTATALKRMELNAAFTFTIPGPKMIWQFGELGYDYSRCYQATNGEGGDCNTKLDSKPIRWDYQNNPNRKSLFGVYSKLLALRNIPNFLPTFTGNDVIYNLAGGFKWIKVSSDSLKLMVVGNFDVVPTTGTVTFQNAGTWYNYITGGTRTASGSAETITLQPGEYIVYTNRDANNLVTTPVRNIANRILDMRLSMYPNPVNKLATIVYDLPESGVVNISVMSLVGQKVAQLYNGFKPKGTQQLTMNTSLFNPGSLAAGNYLLKLELNGKMKVQQFKVAH